MALVNRYPFAREIAVSLAELGIGGEWWVRGLWTNKCEGKHAERYLAMVPPHGTKLVARSAVRGATEMGFPRTCVGWGERIRWTKSWYNTSHEGNVKV